MDWPGLGRTERIASPEAQPGVFVQRAPQLALGSHVFWRPAHQSVASDHGRVAADTLLGQWP